MSIFSDAEKAEMDALLNEAFDSFKERLIIYKTPTKAFVETVPSNFNFAFGGQQAAFQEEYITNSGEFYGTIEYIDQQDNQQLQHLPQDTPVQLSKGIVRIGVSGAEAASYLQDCEKIVFDNRDFRRISDVMPRGLFSRNFYDCWLQKIDNG